MTQSIVSFDIKELDVTWQKDTEYYITFSKGFTQEVGNNRTLSDTQTVYTNALGLPLIKTFATDPSLLSVNPAFNSSDIALPQIKLTYDRAVVNNNTGSLYLYKTASPSDILVTTISGTDTRVTTSLSTATIDLSANYELFEGGQEYYITSQPTAFRDIFNFPTDTLDSSKVKFTYKISPSLINVTPASTSTGVYLPQIKLTYDRPMTELTTSSNFYLYRRDEGSDSLVLTMNNTNSRVVTSGTTATINLSLDYDLFDPLKYYYITNDLGVLRDPFLLPNLAITNTSTIAFTYVDNPKLQSVTPALGATNIALPSIRLNYNSRLNKGVLGTIDVYKTETNELVLSFPPTDSRFTATNTTTAIINLTNERTLFEGNTYYTITVGNKSLRDAVTFIGTDAINAGTIGFRYKPNPNLVSISPTNRSSDVALPRIRLTYNEPVMKTDQGNFYLYKGTTSSNVLVTTIAGTDTRVSTSVSTATIDLSQNYGYFEGGQTYFLTNNPRTITDLYNLPTPELSSSNAFFTYRLNPVTTSTYPADNQSEILLPNIRIGINRTADIGTGTVYLYKYQNNTGTLELSIPTTDSRISTSGTNFFINLTTATNVFESGRDYYLTNSVGALRDDSKLPLLDLDREKLNFTYYLDPFPGVAVLTSNISDFSSATSVTFTVTSSLSVSTGTFSLKETYFEGGFYPDFFITQYIGEGFDSTPYQGFTSNTPLTLSSAFSSTSTSITVNKSAGGTNPVVAGHAVLMYSRSQPQAIVFGFINSYTGTTMLLRDKPPHWDFLNGFDRSSSSPWPTIDNTIYPTSLSDWNIVIMNYDSHYQTNPLIKNASPNAPQRGGQTTTRLETNGFNKWNTNTYVTKIISVEAPPFNTWGPVYQMFIDPVISGWNVKRGSTGTYAKTVFDLPLYIDSNYTPAPYITSKDIGKQRYLDNSFNTNNDNDYGFGVPWNFQGGGYSLTRSGVGTQAAYIPSHVMIKIPGSSSVGYYQVALLGPMIANNNGDGTRDAQGWTITPNTGKTYLKSVGTGIIGDDYVPLIRYKTYPFQRSYFDTQDPVELRNPLRPTTPTYNGYHYMGHGCQLIFLAGTDVILANRTNWDNPTFLNSLHIIGGWAIDNSGNIKGTEDGYLQSNSLNQTTSNNQVGGPFETDKLNFPNAWKAAYGEYYGTSYLKGDIRPTGMNTETFISNVLGIGKFDLFGLPPSTLTNVLLGSSIVTNTSTVTFNVSTSSFVNKGTPSNLQGYHFFIAELSKNEIDSHLYKGTTSTLVTLNTN